MLLMVYLSLIKILGGDMYPLRYDSVSLDEYDTHTVNLHGCSFLTLGMKDEDILNLWKMRKYPMAQCHIIEDFNFEQQSCENPRCCMKVVAKNNMVLTLNFKISIWPAFCVCLRLLHSII
jgi:hypothetical protein